MKKIALALLFANVAAGSSFALNPQPEPPGHAAFSVQGVSNPGVIRGINPIPEPPGNQVMINPQPLPPGGKVMINPQPLPPKLQ